MTNTEQRLTALEKLLFETDQYRNSGGELPYKVYTALLTQSGTNAPVATVLQNTLGSTPTYSYGAVGRYYINCTDCFIENKTWITPQTANNVESAGFNNGVHLTRTNNNTIQLLVFDDGEQIDDGLINHSIEIRVYP